MQTILPSVVNANLNFSLNIKNPKQQPFSSPSNNTLYKFPHSAPPPISGGVCRSSQVGELFPTTTTSVGEIVVREARIKELWEVAETHCSSFFPRFSFYLDFALRLNRFLSMLFAFSLPEGCKRTCLVAVGGFEGNVAGILTVDTLANFLPRKGPLQLRRTGIAYISNVAVREKFRRKGIAKRLIAKAEATAKTWGCLSIALHCDLRDRAVVELYTSQGFKSIKVPAGANWPHPRAAVDVEFNFMMKLLNSPTTTTSAST